MIFFKRSSFFLVLVSLPSLRNLHRFLFLFNFICFYFNFLSSLLFLHCYLGFLLLLWLFINFRNFRLLIHLWSFWWSAFYFCWFLLFFFLWFLRSRNRFCLLLFNLRNNNLWDRRRRLDVFLFLGSFFLSLRLL